MRLSALLLVLALCSALPLSGCDSTGIDPDGLTPRPCTSNCDGGTDGGDDGGTDDGGDDGDTDGGDDGGGDDGGDGGDDGGDGDGGDPGPETMVHLDPRDTFLRTSYDPDALGPAFLPLADLGLADGTVACFAATGDYDLGLGMLASQNEQPLVIAAFSASDALAGPDEPVRIADRVGPDAGLVTPVTAIDLLDTDFAEDFDATDACIPVPTGATHVFLGAWDAYYSDNTPAGDAPFGVRIWRQ